MFKVVDTSSLSGEPTWRPGIRCEAPGDVSGFWVANTYPGVQCEAPGDISRFKVVDTPPLSGEPTCHWWIPLTNGEWCDV